MISIPNTEKLNTTVVTPRYNDGVVSSETASAIKHAQEENQHFLRIPRRFAYLDILNEISIATYKNVMHLHVAVKGNEFFFIYYVGQNGMRL